MEVLINIDVDDLDRAASFYRDALGLQPARHLGDDALELGGASVRLYLLRKAAGTVATQAGAQARDYRRHWTPVHLDFAVENIETAVQRARTAGALLEGGINTYKWGRLATLSDPFGNGFCLIEFIGRGYDEIAS